MATFLLCIYIALIFIRPMDWVDMILGWQLVTSAAIATIFVSFPKLLSEVPKFWRAVPEIRVAFMILVGVVCSWLHPFWLTALNDSFQEFGKILVLFILVVILSQDKRSFRVLLWSILLCTAWMALHSILMGRGAREIGGAARGFGPALPRWRPAQRGTAMEGAGVWQVVAYGIFEDPNDLCLVFILAIPLLYAEYKNTTNPMVKMICLGLVPINIYAAWFTNSRGGIMGVFGMASAYIVGRLKGFKRWVMIVFSVGIVTVGMPARGSELGVIDKERLVLWGDGLDGFRQSPLNGWGYKNFASVSDGLAAHNSYIHCLAELGMIGYIPWILLIVLTLTHLRRAAALKNHVSSIDQVYLVGLYSALIGYLTAVYFISRCYSHVLFILLGLAIGKVVMSCRDAESFRLVFGPTKRDVRLGLYFAFGSIPFIWFTVRMGYKMGGG